MKALILLPIALACAGCNSLQFTAEKADGTKVTVKSTRVVWSTEQYNAVVTGFGSLSATKSSVDAAAIQAAAAGAVQGVMASQGARNFSPP